MEEPEVELLVVKAYFQIEEVEQDDGELSVVLVLGQKRVSVLLNEFGEQSQLVVVGRGQVDQARADQRQLNYVLQKLVVQVLHRIYLLVHLDQ